MLKQVGLADHASAEKLSPGLSRRLALGRAILHHPQVLLPADPLASCEQTSVKLLGQVMHQQAEAGVAVLIFAHEAADLELICNTVYRLNQGKISESFNSRDEQQHQRPFTVPARGDEKIILIDRNEDSLSSPKIAAYEQSLHLALMFYGASFAGYGLHAKWMLSRAEFEKFGHTQTAQALKIEVKSIVLWLLGGFSNICETYERPIHNLLIAGAGPLVNLLLALVMGLIQKALHFRSAFCCTDVL